MIAAVVSFAPIEVAYAQLYATGPNVFLKYVSSVVVQRSEASSPEPDLILFPSRWGVNLGFTQTALLGPRVRTITRSFTTVDCRFCSTSVIGASITSLSEAGDVFAFNTTLEEWANGFRVLPNDQFEALSRLLDYANYSPVATENPGGAQAFFLTKLDSPDGNYTHELRIAPLGFGADVPQMVLRTGGLAMAAALPAVSVPEPSTFVLLASGLALLGCLGASRRRRLR